MIVYQRANRRRTILALIVLTAVTLITLDVRGAGPISAVRGGAHDVVNPIAGASDAVFSPVGDWIDGVTSATALKDENARLRRRLDSIRGQQASARAATEENKELKKLLDLPFVVDADSITAPVVDGAPSNFEFTVQIGKGESDGIGVDMPVVTGAGLVGRVLEVSRDRATVLLITDPASGVGVKIERSGTTGVVKGRGDSNTVRADFVDPNAAVTKGEIVYTSGQQNSPFPSAIPVGTVSKVTKTSGDLQQDILVKPLVDVSHLDYVKVLRPSSGR
ncbi:MAG TPA: rod shape-determining protein MreC [Acidimicrobiia bacterium]|nr:rod shape-determining protein MreC [Acidimicrobiia bacterium]